MIDRSGRLEGCVVVTSHHRACRVMSTPSTIDPTPPAPKKQDPNASYQQHTYHERIDEEILEAEQGHSVLHLKPHHEGLEEVGPLLDGARVGSVLRRLELCIGLGVVLFWGGEIGGLIMRWDSGGGGKRGMDTYMYTHIVDRCTSTPSPHPIAPLAYRRSAPGDCNGSAA